MFHRIEKGSIGNEWVKDFVDFYKRLFSELHEVPAFVHSFSQSSFPSLVLLVPSKNEDTSVR